jgi:hypothetical protein
MDSNETIEPGAHGRECPPASASAARFYARRKPMAFAFILATLTAAMAAQAGDEPAPAFKASALLPAATLKGTHYRIEDQVATDGYYHQFGIASDYGKFVALGRSLLAVRLSEVQALAALEEVSKTEVFLAAAGGAVVNVGKSAANVVTDPVGTAKGVGAGVKRLGVNIGRVTKRTADSVTDSDKEGPTEGKDSSAETAANTVLGVSSAMRRWAQKVGADPYTTNRVLREALKDIARIDAAGSIATKVVVPIPAVVTTTSDVGRLVWSKDPEELRKLNEQRAKAIGVAPAVAGAFFKNGWFTLTSQTRLIAALDAVKVKGCADYVEAASKAESEREALFFVESAEMLQRFHARTPVKAILNDSRAIVAALGMTAVALLPLDFVRSTAETRDALREIGDRARKELGAARLELHLTGRASERAAKEMKASGWEVRQQVANPWQERVG